MARLAVRTDDFQLSYKLIKILKSKSLDFEVLDINKPLPSEDIIWFSSALEILNDGALGRPIPTDIDSIENAVHAAILQLSGVQSSVLLIIGIDPGPYPGIASLVDGAFIGVSQLKSIEEIVPKIKQLSSSLDCKEMLIRVGDGVPLMRDRIINHCISNNWVVEEVNESSTSKGLVRNNHSISALRIAANSGSKVWQLRELRPTSGHIKYIQGESRKLSNGEITISKRLAQMVACGDLTLAEAIHIHSTHSSEE